MGKRRGKGGEGSGTRMIGNDLNDSVIGERYITLTYITGTNIITNNNIYIYTVSPNHTHDLISPYKNTRQQTHTHTHHHVHRRHTQPSHANKGVKTKSKNTGINIRVYSRKLIMMAKGISRFKSLRAYE